MRTRSVVTLLALVALVPAPASAQQTATGSVAGIVASAEGEPLAGVCVQVLDQPVRTGSTSADGSYRVDDVREGSYLVTFNACADHLPGYAAEYYDDAGGYADAREVQVQAGTVTAGVDAALPPAAVVSGVVTSEGEGGPLPGSCVVAIDQQAGLIVSTRTEADGSYALSNLRGGDYELLFVECVEPFHHLPELYDDVSLDDYSSRQQQRTVVTVASGDERSGVDAALELGGAVRGTTRALHTGREVSLVCVGLFPPDADATSFPLRSTISGLESENDPGFTPGDFLLGGIRPGSYLVGFQPPACGGNGYATQWAPGQADRSAAQPLTVVRGETLVVDAVVAPQPSIDYACEREEIVAGGTFSDVSGDSPHRLAIDCVAYYEVVSGYGDGTYRPAQVVRRDQMATFIAGALRATGAALPPDPPDAFSDDDGSVHEQAINQLAALGVVGGTGGGRYSPAQAVSRAQMATFLVNAYEETTGYELRAAGDAFSDDDGSVHEARIDAAATAGLTAGTGGGAYRPGGQVRREQMATFVARLLNRVQLDRATPGVFAQGVADPRAQLATSLQPFGLATR